MSTKLKSVVRQFCPPAVWNGLSLIRGKVHAPSADHASAHSTPDHQDLELYWNAEMAQVLETWGEGTVWDEIQFLMVNCEGKVLDIACGTGKTIEVVSKFPNIELYGCDISDFLLSKAADRGIDRDRLKVCDATNTDYPDKFFDYSYSIGSLEHFTEDGITAFLKEADRITKRSSFHLIPICPTGDQGWITPSQSYFNNSVDWWLPKFRQSFSSVHVLRSKWEDGNRSIGQWFICSNEGRT